MDSAKFSTITGNWDIRILRLVAEGGMSMVYEGELRGCEGFRKRVAVKILRPKWTDDECFMDLFADEARLVSDLVHENIVQIYQLDRTPDGGYYIVMEFVDGLPLHDFIQYHNENELTIPEELAVHIASRIARGLEYAHNFRDRQGKALNIVHRDVCPRNILVTTEGLSKLTDFGIAKALNNTVIADHWLTGKLRYMSPEQAARQPLDPSTDIFSLGAVLYEMLSGAPIRPEPSDHKDPGFARNEILWNALPAHTGDKLISILRRMLCMESSKRYQNSGEVARILEEYIYSDGYGPTINTVEEYMRIHFPYLYRYEDDAPKMVSPFDTTVVEEG